MKSFFAAVPILALGAPFAQVLAQHQNHSGGDQSVPDRAGSTPSSHPGSAAAAEPHFDHTATSPEPPEAPPPSAAFEGPRHAADAVFGPSTMAAAREELREDQGAIRTYRLLADQFETRSRDGRTGYYWNVQGWYGGDINKVWVKTEGEDAPGAESKDAEVQALWSRAVTPWFNFQTGLRYDLEPAPERRHLVVGVQGLVPYRFEIDGAAFLTDGGELNARLEAEYDQFITQRLILQPRIELNAAAQGVPELGIGSGLSSAKLGFRLRYEIARELAPYVGVEYEELVGGTADFARGEREEIRGWNVVLGLRAWF